MTKNTQGGAHEMAKLLLDDPTFAQTDHPLVENLVALQEVSGWLNRRLQGAMERHNPVGEQR